MHDELGELVKAGLSPAEALRAATVTSRRISHARGLRYGAGGSILRTSCCDANPLTEIANTRRIRTVFQGGRSFDRAALDSMLARVERAALPNAQTACGSRQFLVIPWHSQPPSTRVPGSTRGRAGEPAGAQLCRDRQPCCGRETAREAWGDRKPGQSNGLYAAASRR